MYESVSESADAAVNEYIGQPNSNFMDGSAGVYLIVTLRMHL